MTEIHLVFYDNQPANLPPKYAVLIAFHQDQMLWCRHRDRNTWEIPGGHIEAGETVLEAAARELQVETGAIGYAIQPICWYSAYRLGQEPHSCGLLCRADIDAIGPLENEIEEIQHSDKLPSALTYPSIQPQLIQEALFRGYI